MSSKPPGGPARVGLVEQHSQARRNFDTQKPAVHPGNGAEEFRLAQVNNRHLWACFLPVARAGQVVARTCLVRCDAPAPLATRSRVNTAKIQQIRGPEPVTSSSLPSVHFRSFVRTGRRQNDAGDLRSFSRNLRPNAARLKCSDNLAVRTNAFAGER